MSRRNSLIAPPSLGAPVGDHMGYVASWVEAIAAKRIAAGIVSFLFAALLAVGTLGLLAVCALISVIVGS